MNMKPQFKILMSFSLLLLMSLSWLKGQEKPANYGNIPDDLVAYDKYQKA